MTYTEYRGEYLSTNFRSGTRYIYHIRVPEDCGDAPLALLVTHDGLCMAEAKAMETLANTGEAPLCAVVGLRSGTMEATLPGGAPRRMRFNDYDVFSPAYADFLVDEFIPYIQEKYTLNLSTDPNLHLISGGSSGGISAWNGVWFRNDYFRRAYLSSPTFSAMARGNMAPVMMRLFETKPIRVYIDFSENEPDDYFGSSLCAALEGQRALEFAGYDYQWAYYPGEGHCSRLNDEKTATEILRFLWSGWQTQPVRPKRFTSRSEALLYPDEPWRGARETMPSKDAVRTAAGEYEIRNNTVVFRRAGKEKTVLEGFGQLSAIALSTDLWRMYLADALRGCVYVCSVDENGDLRDKKILASLQMPTDFTLPGATDLVVDSRDRIYAATELGVQCIRTFGLVDLILPLPKNKVPQKLALQGDRLYADCGGEVYVRKIKGRSKMDPLSPETPQFLDYYD